MHDVARIDNKIYKSIKYGDILHSVKKFPIFGDLIIATGSLLAVLPDSIKYIVRRFGISIAVTTCPWYQG